jgi:hypothetical protein
MSPPSPTSGELFTHGLHACFGQRWHYGQQPVDGCALLGLCGQELHEVFDLYHLLRGQLSDLGDQALFDGCIHRGTFYYIIRQAFEGILKVVQNMLKTLRASALSSMF